MSDAPRRRRAAALGLAFLAVAALRVALCFAVPLTTTDAYRNLHFARHAFELEPTVFRAVAADYAPEPWSEIWPEQGFVYGPVVLVFFWAFGAAGLGLVFVKLALTAVDVAVAALFVRRVGPAAGLAVFAAPIALYFVSHEGQYESLQTLWIALSVLAVQDGRWRWAGACFGLAVQTKAFGVLLLPWIAWRWWLEADRGRRLAGFALGGGISLLPFVWFYAHDPLLLLSPLTRGLEASYNPFAWNPFAGDERFLWNPRWLVWWNAAFSLAPLALALVFSARHRRDASRFDLVPLALFWTLVKSLRWAQFWYPLVVPGLLLCAAARHRRWVVLLLALHVLQGARSAAVLSGSPGGWVESVRHRRMMAACMVRCPPGPARQRTTGLPGDDAGRAPATRR